MESEELPEESPYIPRPPPFGAPEVTAGGGTVAALFIFMFHAKMVRVIPSLHFSIVGQFGELASLPRGGRRGGRRKGGRGDGRIRKGCG